MTKFEKARVLGQRAEQIARGAPPTVNIEGLSDAYSITLKELHARKIPLKIRRKYPDGTTREIPVSKMEFD